MFDIKNLKRDKTAVFIGRFRPFHNGHLHTVLTAFNELPIDSLVILVGSCNRHRSLKNPFNFDEVSEMIRRGLPKDISKKVIIASINDIASDHAWQSQVRDLVSAKYIIGSEKDSSSYYLRLFPEMTFVPMKLIAENQKVLSATDFRHDYFEGRELRHIPEGTVKFLQEWKQSRYYADMLAEHNSAEREIAKFSTYPYEGHLNIACADAVVLCGSHVLLVERALNPGKGCLALPGGHKHERETFLQTAIRELQEETHIKVPEKVLLGSIKGEKLFDDPCRSYPHTRITMAYFLDVQPNPDGSLPKVTPDDDALSAKWYPLNTIKERQHLMYDDHYQIIQHFTSI